MSSRFSVAGLQLVLEGRDNRELLAREIDRAVLRFPWVDMIVLPELCTFGFSLAHAEPLPGETEAFFQALAKRHGIWLLPGSLYEKHEGKIYNTATVINPAGEVLTRYRKVYPFRPFEAGVTSGQDIVAFDIPEVGRFGVSICYDGWFPELARAMAWQGVEVILHPTLTTTADREEELILARANAIQNQCYFIDINNAGALGNGRSIVVGPEGDVLHQAGETNEVIPVTIDLERVRHVRRSGIKGLGQVLKSFRDTPITLPCYNTAGGTSAYLTELGALEMQQRSRGSKP